MKQFLLRAFKFLLLVLFPGLLFAQANPDFTVLLNSGKFVPQENAKTISKDTDIFRKSLFQNKYFVTLQFKALPNQVVKEKLAAAGIQLIDYIPNLSYTAAIGQNADLSLLKNSGLRSAFQLTADQKTVPALLRSAFPAHAVKQTGFVDVTIITYETLTKATLTAELLKVKGKVLDNMPMFRSLIARVPQSEIKNLINLPFIQWVEPIDAPNVQENLLGRTLHRVNVLNDGVRNLKGDSVNIGIWDGGEVSPHLDFSPIASRLSIMETSVPESHATHVAGTIGGRGIINPKARGMAPNAKLFSYNFNGNIQSEMATAIPNLKLSVSSHSYGSTQTCGVTGAGVAYSGTSRSTDLNLNNNPGHLHVHSAGNSQTACSGGWSTITGSGKTSKNNILVANITTTEAISGSSSFGPVADGRVKPEISSFGTNVLSTYTPLNTYSTISGTSMATPGVSGTVALLVQRYKQLNNNVAPISSLIKAAICNTAHDLGNPGPDYKFGFGRLNALSAVRALEQNRYAIDNITTGATKNQTISVPAGTAKLKVMLTWNDPAGTTNANPALVNNLDLEVISASGTTLPWILNANSPATHATRGVDNVSNIEQVTIDNPTPGTYTLRVNGTAVPTGANQQYSLTWEVDQPYIEVIYPNGNENLTPAGQETITWNSVGITGNQTVQYSLNNGNTWTTLSTNVPATTTRYTWTVPVGANTATALVRITSGSVSDVSDATFSILGMAAGFNAGPAVCGGALNFAWAAVSNATHYDLYKFNDVTGLWDIMAADVTGTTYTAFGLPSNASMWFCIRSKNSLTGAIGERSQAINRVIPTNNSLALGSISGATVLCAGSQNVTYTVPSASGVSTYNWSVPAGATIVSGQGTSTIAVNYPSTYVIGKVSVYGNTGTCPTDPAELNVTVNSIVAAPTSGGDQVACTLSSATTLTATATVPPNHTLVWYTSPTGGAPVSAAQLSNPGTVTYYAASMNLTGNCESSARTPVTLTLNTTTVPTVTSNAGTTICEGNTVTLTSTPGASYLWSNGETTQSISVRTAGTYSVRVTQPNTCDAASSPMNLTVVPKPTVNLTAEPRTDLMPGLSTTLMVKGNFDSGSTFTWFKNGAVIPGENKANMVATVPATGNYNAEVLTSNGCKVTTNVITLSDLMAEGAFIYPSPNNGRFQVRYFTEPGKTFTNNITVYDSRGARIRLQANEVTQAYERMSVDMSQYGKGVYYVVLTDADGNKIGSGRVVIE